MRREDAAQVDTVSRRSPTPERAARIPESLSRASWSPAGREKTGPAALGRIRTAEVLSRRPSSAPGRPRFQDDGPGSFPEPRERIRAAWFLQKRSGLQSGGSGRLEWRPGREKSRRERSKRIRELSKRVRTAWNRAGNAGIGFGQIGRIRSYR